MCDVTIDNHGYVMATLSANTDKQVPTIGFLAHVDTATDFTGKNVKPQIVNNYDGNDLILNKALDIVLSSTDFPEISRYQGHTVMTTDGTTLLRADNKAGIAEIMTAMEYLLTHPEIKHRNIRLAFTPDEQSGRGPHKVDVEQFNATYAYTVDGGPLGELQYESFNAAVANITFKGSNVHPGTAKDKMVHAGKIAAEFIEKFPEQEAPEYTEKYQGFYHLLSMSGDVEKAELTYIIRDFDQLNFEARKKEVDEFITEIKERHPRVQVERMISDQYYNMREKIEPVIEVVDLAHQAMVNLDITSIVEPIRCGTDGSQIVYKE